MPRCAWIATYENPVHHHNPIEILASIASWEERDGVEHLMLYDTTRSVDMLRDVVSHSFGLTPEQVHIVSKFIGGAFGSKAWTYHNPLLVALAAKVVGRPLRLEWRRQQVYSIGGHRPAQRRRLRIGAEPDGRMRALHHWTRQHSSMISGYTEYGSRMTKMMYAVPELGFTNELAHLNLPSPSVTARARLPDGRLGAGDRARRAGVRARRRSYRTAPAQPRRCRSG